MNAAAVCKWMGGWSYQDYRAAPMPMIAAIIDAINDEAKRYGDR